MARDRKQRKCCDFGSDSLVPPSRIVKKSAKRTWVDLELSSVAIEVFFQNPTGMQEGVLFWY